MFGFLLLISLPLVILTGLLDYIAYGPKLHQAIPAHVGFLHLPYFDWPTRPAWLFQLTEGLHVGLGLVLIPVVLAKLWSVMPKLFTWPPARSVAHVLERLSLILIVGGIVFEMVTGLLNIQYDYIFGFSFYTAHYFGAWVFIVGFVVHVSLKFPTMVRSLRSQVAAHGAPHPTGRHQARAAGRGRSGGLVARRRPPSAAGERWPWSGAGRCWSPCSPSVRASAAWPGMPPCSSPAGARTEAGPTTSRSTGPRSPPRSTRPTPAPAWRLSLGGGPDTVTLTRPMLLAMEQHTADLPIACVEGWSTTQRWTGVRLADLARLAGVAAPASAHVRSLDTGGGFGQARLQSNQVLDPDALLALKVNGVDLSSDHGFPARIIVPALPGVHCTKWVRSIDFEA